MMYYLIAASVPAEIQQTSVGDSALYNDFYLDIMCSRWSAAFAKSKVLRMSPGLQSQLYINAKNKFRSSRVCPTQSPSNQAPSTQQPLTIPSSDGGYVPSSSPIWGGTFK